MQTHHIYVEPEHAGERLDKFLSQCDFIPSRSRAAELISAGHVTLHGQPLKASFKVQAGLTLKVNVPTAPQVGDLLPLDLPIDILYEDADVIVVNKPSGLVVHPSAGHEQDTLVNILLHHVSELSMGFNEQRPGIVHRLDRDTSGILVVAKNDSTHHHLALQFRTKTARRVYWAVVYGRPKWKEQTFRTHLARHPVDRKRYASATTGKLAITHARVLHTTDSNIAWVRCQLETGRTHQIRVHLSEAGHAIVDDPIYGPRKAPALTSKTHPGRLALHACELGFTHPRTGEPLFFSVPWPEPLQTWIKTMGFPNVPT